MAAALLEQVINGLMTGSIYVLIALGMVLIYGVMHVLNFAHGVLFMLGGYFCHFFFTRLTGSYALALVLSMAMLAAVGIALERGVFRPLQGNLRNQVIASLGLILAIENLVIALWGPNALQMKVPATEQLVPIGELRFPLQHLMIIGITALVVGIPVERMDVFSFAIGTALAALGGALVGPLFLVFPLMGDAPMVKGLAGILLGGMGSVPGAVIGGLIIGVAESVSTLFLPTDYRDSVAFAIMVLILLVRPRGLFGVRTRGED